MARIRVRTYAVALFLAAGLGAVRPVAAQPVQESEHHAFRVVTVADGLRNPWSIAFLPGGEILVTERPGRLRIIRNGVLQPEPIAGVPAVLARNQGGLLDAVLHPDFENNRLVYLSYSKPNADGSESTTSIVRGRLDLERHRLSEVEEVLEAAAWGSRTGHYGSRLAFDRDGYLYITIGDRQNPPAGDLAAHVAQDLTNHMGTVLRLHDDGRVPADNPFVGRGDARPEIWSYGHRNAQGLAIHPESGDVWLNEHGPQGGDELNLVRRGANYGWPVVGHGVNYGGAVIHGATSAEGMEDPVHHWTPSIATSGFLIYTGDVFPAWHGSFFVGGMARPNGGALVRLAMDGRSVVSEERLLEGTRVRDIRQGPDGYIYVAVDHRGGDTTPLIRLEPVGGN